MREDAEHVEQELQMLESRVRRQRAELLAMRQKQRELSARLAMEREREITEALLQSAATRSLESHQEIRHGADAHSLATREERTIAIRSRSDRTNDTRAHRPVSASRTRMRRYLTSVLSESTALDTFSGGVSPSLRTPSSFISRLESWECSSASEVESCSICLADYERGDRLTGLPCAHVFHSSCVEKWLARAITCPLCKLELV